jgi:hypothetical protein
MLIKAMATHEVLTKKKNWIQFEKKKTTLPSQIHLNMGQNVMNDS